MDVSLRMFSKRMLRVCSSWRHTNRPHFWLRIFKKNCCMFFSRKKLQKYITCKLAESQCSLCRPVGEAAWHSLKDSGVILVTPDEYLCNTTKCLHQQIPVGLRDNVIPCQYLILVPEYRHDMTWFPHYRRYTHTYTTCISLTHTTATTHCILY